MKVAIAVASGFRAASAETVTDPMVDGPDVGIGVAAAEGVAGGAEAKVGGAEDMLGGGEAESWAV